MCSPSPITGSGKDAIRIRLRLRENSVHEQELDHASNLLRLDFGSLAPRIPAFQTLRPSGHLPLAHCAPSCCRRRMLQTSCGRRLAVHREAMRLWGHLATTPRVA